MTNLFLTTAKIKGKKSGDMSANFAIGHAHRLINRADKGLPVNKDDLAAAYKLLQLLRK